MLRRAQFQFGTTLFKGPRGQIDAGLGKGTSRGTVTLIPPTVVIKQPIDTPDRNDRLVWPSNDSQ
jgi:alkyl sulfatase BDS1-like metallo-beta-lactamase superfamily hydrolase